MPPNVTEHVTDEAEGTIETPTAAGVGSRIAARHRQVNRSLRELTEHVSKSYRHDARLQARVGHLADALGALWAEEREVMLSAESNAQRGEG